MNETVNETTTVTVNVADALAISRAVLQAAGDIPLHHTVLVQRAKDMGLNPNNLDLATKIWSDTRKDSEKSEFWFLGKGVFALKTSAAVTQLGKQTDPTPYVPTRARSTNTGALTNEQLDAKITRLTTELAAATALREARANGTAPTPPPTPTLPRAKSREELEAEKDKAALAGAASNVRATRPAPPAPPAPAPAQPTMPELEPTTTA